MPTQLECYVKPFRDTWIKTLKSDKVLQISDGTISGLHLRYSPLTNKISFYLGCRIKSSGVRRNIFLGRYGEMNIQEIKDLALDYRKQISHGQDPMYEKEETRRRQEKELAKRIKVDALFQDYMQKYTKLHKKGSTYKSNEDQYRLYLKPKFGDKYITDVADKHILDAYSDWAQKTSFSTANKALSLLSSFWKWCMTYDYVPKAYNPCHYVKKGKNPKIHIQLLDTEGYQKFFAALDAGPIDSEHHPRFFDVIRFMALTGGRSQEIRHLTWEETDLQNKILHLRDSKTGPRDIKLSDAAFNELQKIIQKNRGLGSEYIFPGIQDPTKPICDIRKALMWTLGKAGLKHMRIHDLRHSFISMGANMGENIMALKEAAGHSKITTTEGYIHLAADTTYKTVNNIAHQIYNK